MTKHHVLIVFLLFTVIIGATVMLQHNDSPTGTGGIRQPTVLIPDSISVARYYDEESDVLCWIFTKELAGGGFDVTSACLPREVTDY